MTLYTQFVELTRRYEYTICLYKRITNLEVYLFQKKTSKYNQKKKHNYSLVLIFIMVSAL